MIYFTADPHLGHYNIIKHCSRPFPNTEVMDATILDNINSIVNAEDTLWILGDVAWKGKSVAWYLDNIKCRNINIVIGNHDNKQDLGKLQKDGRIILYYGFVDTSIHGHKITLCHYPMKSWNCSFRGAYHLYGHVHGRGIPLRWSMDVGVDSNDFRPVSWDQVLEYMKRYDEELPHNSSKWFNNLSCEYYPCHEGQVNCMFCFCPLYNFECPGDYQHTDKGIKDCSNCSLPHTKDGYEKIMLQLKLRNSKLSG